MNLTYRYNLILATLFRWHETCTIPNPLHYMDKEVFLGVRSLLKYIQKSIFNLNIYNANTFACHDLLRHNLQLPSYKIKYYLFKSVSKHPLKEQELFDKLKPKYRKAIFKRQRKEFKQCFKLNLHCKFK